MHESLNNEKTSLYNDDQDFDEYDLCEVFLEENNKVVNFEILAEYEKPYLAGKHQFTIAEKLQIKKQ